MSKTQNVLEVKNLVKRFHIGFFRTRVDAVRSVSFHVQKGEIFGLLGPNGAGKTTTIKTLMGLIRPTGGEISIFDGDFKDPEVRRKVGYLPENPYFHEYLTPRELLAFHGRLAGLSKPEIEDRTDHLIAHVGLAEAANRPLRKFSKGMLQRVGLAQALLASPELLVLDEPMSGLDPLGRKFVTDLMTTLNDGGTTILFSSHILSDVERLCDRVVILNKGRKAAEGSIDELLETDAEATSFEELFVRKAFENTEEISSGAS
jgi:ABC-2 type transport system ATP-binding protein